MHLLGVANLTTSMKSHIVSFYVKRYTQTILYLTELKGANKNPGIALQRFLGTQFKYDIVGYNSDLLLVLEFKLRSDLKVGK